MTITLKERNVSLYLPQGDFTAGGDLTGKEI